MPTSPSNPARPPGSDAGSPEHRAKLRQHWATHRQERREAIACGYVSAYLHDHPERLFRIVRTAEEAAAGARK